MNRTKTRAEEAAEAIARERWDTDEALRAEFGSVDVWLAYARAEASGDFHIHGGSVTRVRIKVTK